MESVPGGVARATQAVIDLRSITRNIAAIRRKIGPDRHLMAVVKADGYGHGAIKVARTALGSGADWLGVALPEEGRQLREAGIDAPILVFGLIQPEEAYKVIGADLDQAICSVELLEALDREAAKASKKADVHLKVDTGMGRIGVMPDEAGSFAGKVQSYKNLNLKGIFSHFATADKEDKSFATRQLELFEGVLSDLGQAGIDIPIRHMANSAAVLDLPQSYYDMVRPGIMIYGLYPSNAVSRSIELKPAMTLKTKVSAVKTVAAGTSISYGRTFITQGEATVVATLPLGYADGLSRLLSNRGEVLVRGRRAPLIGTVCMDMCMVDISDVGGVKRGDEVIIFGEEPSADEVAEKAGTVNYEITCAVSKRVPRIYIE